MKTTALVVIAVVVSSGITALVMHNWPTPAPDEGRKKTTLRSADATRRPFARNDTPQAGAPAAEPSPPAGDRKSADVAASKTTENVDGNDATLPLPSAAPSDPPPSSRNATEKPGLSQEPAEKPLEKPSQAVPPPTKPTVKPTVVANFVFSEGWATFGLALPQGTTWEGLKVGSEKTQTDVQTRWPDGSVRFAAVTAWLPKAGTYAIWTGPENPGKFQPQVPDATVRLQIGNRQFTAQCPAKPSQDFWLDGPLVTEWRANVAPVDAAGAMHPFLRPSSSISAAIATARAGSKSWSRTCWM